MLVAFRKAVFEELRALQAADKARRLAAKAVPIVDLLADDTAPPPPAATIAKKRKAAVAAVPVPAPTAAPALRPQGPAPCSTRT